MAFTILALTLGLSACGGDDAALGSGASGGFELKAGKPIACKSLDPAGGGKAVNVGSKRITIHNNSAITIYPVLATSANPINEWVLGCLGAEANPPDLLPTRFVYKLYINDGQGLPPRSEVTITLPLYSELRPTADNPDRYITWWNGGRVLLADRTVWLRDEGGKDKLMGTPGGVECKGSGGVTCSLSTYFSEVQFEPNVFAQLSEYTFGDAVWVNGQRRLKPENVGYNISYVDHVYMPVAIGPRGNPHIGYSGSVKNLGEFREILGDFLKNEGDGWPVYNMFDKNDRSKVRLPGGYNILADRGGFLPGGGENVPVQPKDGHNPPVLTVMKCIEGACSENEKRQLQWGKAVQNIQDLWAACVDWGSEDISRYSTMQYPQHCNAPDEMKQTMAAVKEFFAKNHENYLVLHAAKPCASPIPPHVAEFKYWEALKHIYGWVPFNEGCAASDNALAGNGTDSDEDKAARERHAEIQGKYIRYLQYSYELEAVQADPTLDFNPYVKLIHEDLGMMAYGFSVDDAVGFMTELGDGLVFTVGGAQGLENPRPFSYADGFSVGLGVPLSVLGKEHLPIFKDYSVCPMNPSASDLDSACEPEARVVMPAHSQIAGFRVGTVAKYPVKVHFTDLDGNVYKIPVMEKFKACTPEDEKKLGKDNCSPTNALEIVDRAKCKVLDPQGQPHPKSGAWCNTVNPNRGRSEHEVVVKNHLSYGVPANYLP